MIVFDDVPASIVVAYFRRPNRRTNNRESDLCTVGMTRHEKLYPLRKPRKDVGIMCERNDWLTFGDLRDRFADALWTRPQIGKTSKPNRSAACFDFYNFIFQNLNAVRL